MKTDCVVCCMLWFPSSSSPSIYTRSPAPPYLTHMNSQRCIARESPVEARISNIKWAEEDYQAIVLSPSCSAKPIVSPGRAGTEDPWCAIRARALASSQHMMTFGRRTRPGHASWCLGRRGRFKSSSGPVCRYSSRPPPQR